MKGDYNVTDKSFMAEALALARLGLGSTDPNPRVGCVIVADGKIVGSGYHRRAGEDHAEVHALREAGLRARGATAYVTLEPCSHFGRTPPCADALIQAGIARVVAAMTDPCDKVAGGGLARLRENGVQVVVGVLAEEAESLSRGFFHRMRTGLPWIRLKLAQSLDGRSAMADGESQWITGEPARAHAQFWRARSSAIVTGVDTVLADDCRLTVRPRHLPAGMPFDESQDQPVRVILDTHLRLGYAAAVLFQPGQTVILTAADRCKRREWLGGFEAARRERRMPQSSQVSLQPVGIGNDKRLDLVAVRQWLADQAFNEILIEAGPTLAGAWLQAGLVDEVLVYTAPLLLGSDARPVVALPVQRLCNAVQLDVRYRELVGADEFLRARVVKKTCNDQHSHL